MTPHRWRAHSAAPLLTIAIALGCPGVAVQSATVAGDPPIQPGATDWSALGDEIVEHVRNRFFDARRGAAWADRNRGYARGIVDASSFGDQTSRRLAELDTSHVGWFSVDDPGHAALREVFHASLSQAPTEVDSIGIEIGADGLVRRVLAGGAAEEVGLRRGDRILQADGRPFHPVRSIRDRAGRPTVLSVQRGADRPAMDVRIVPRRVRLVDEWRIAQRLGTTEIEVDGVRIGIVPMVSCAGAMPREELERALDRWAHATSDASSIQALVLDFRGGWGGCAPDLVDLFSTQVPDLRVTGRDGRTQRVDARWRGPLVILVDEGTRSGKEVVARAIQRHGRGSVVGQRTAGAVVGGQCLELGDGSLLYLAVVDVHVDGERLEGIGVTPCVVVPDDLPFVGDSNDPQDATLAAGLAEAVRLVRRRAEVERRDGANDARR